MCSVLRCNAPGAARVPLDLELPALEAVVCEEHLGRIRDGEAWTWDDDGGRILMGDDLDSGGALILGEWAFSEQLGSSELVLQCRTPSGKAHEPVRFVISRDELRVFLSSFGNLFPDLIAPPPAGAED